MRYGDQSFGIIIYSISLLWSLKKKTFENINSVEIEFYLAKIRMTLIFWYCIYVDPLMKKKIIFLSRPCAFFAISKNPKNVGTSLNIF